MPKKSNSKTTNPITNDKQDKCNGAVGKEEITPLNPRIDIRVYSSRKRLADPEGLSAKAVIDQIVTSGLLADDSTKEVREVRYFQKKISRDEEEETILVLEELDEESCIEWDGAHNKEGYGRKRISGKSYYVHRLAYEEYFGPIPDGMFVCHKCDNPKCYNPAHLFLGTQKDNIQDAVKKGRHKYATFTNEKHPMCKLSDVQVREIRELYKTGEYKMRELAMKYLVSLSQISRIINKQSRG